MEYESLTIRIPLDLKQMIEQVADSEHRSLSGQVRFFLESSVRRNHTEAHEIDAEELAGRAEG
jgi:hypothetical protein